MRIRILLKHSKVLKSIYPTYVKAKTKLRLWWMAHTEKPITEEMLVTQLGRLGIAPGDKIMVHSAGSKIGMIEGGPDTLVRALKRYITPEGLIVMPSFPHRGMYEYLEHYTIFDVANTPSKNGAITEHFRTSDGVVRSAHPTHPLCAWGKEAKQFVEGHEYSQAPFDAKSPYKKLIDWNVKIVLIGVNFDHLTLMRSIDDLYPNFPIITYIPNKIYKVPIKLYNGEVIMVETPCHDPYYLGEIRDNMLMYPYVKDKIQYSKLGHAETWVIDSKTIYGTLAMLADRGEYTFIKYYYKNDQL